MIYVTRPVTESHKTVPKTVERSLYNNLNKRDSQVQVKDYSSKASFEIPSSEEERTFIEENLQKAIRETNEAIFGIDERFEFQIHEKTGRYMVKLVNNETDEVIREIPPEKILDLIASIWELVGILVDERG